MSKGTILNAYRALSSRLPDIKEVSEELEDSNDGKKKKKVSFFE